jgi:ribosomal protein S7
MIRLQKRVIKRKRTLFFLFINRFIRSGKKDIIYSHWIITLIYIKKLFKYTFNKILLIILNNIKPLVELKPKFSSGIIYFLPYPIKEYKSIVLGLTWLVRAIDKRFELSLKDKLMIELEEIMYNRGAVSRLKRDYYKIILENRVQLYRFKKKFKF